MFEPLTSEEMDTYAKQAESILMSYVEKTEVTVFDIAKWWRENLMRCGHKRLGRIILKFNLREE